MVTLTRTVAILTLVTASGFAAADEKPILVGPELAVAPLGVVPATPQSAYGPLEAGQESYMLGEERRRAALERQRFLVAAAPYLASSPAIVGPPAPYLYSSPAYRPRRAYRTGAWLYPGAAVFPGIPADVYGGIPLPAEIRQPDGHLKYWTGPNGYIYRPTYRSSMFDDDLTLGPPSAAPAPELAPILDAPANEVTPKIQEFSRVPPEPAPAAMPAPVEVPGAEAIPAPLAEPEGPREF